MRSFRLSAHSMEELRAEAARRHGPEARLVDAVRVRRQGFGRLFARDEVEATVLVPDAPDAVRPGIDRAGIAALLAEADGADGDGPAPSTASPAFAELLAQVEAGLLPAGETRPPAPTTTTQAPTTPPAPEPEAAAEAHEPLTSLRIVPGDLVLLIGLGDDPLRAAPGILDRHPVLELDAGIDGRRTALRRRADAVERDRAVLHPRPAGLRDDFAGAAALGADVVVAVVDASRTPADTRAWVSRLARVAGVHALLVVGAEHTADPAHVHGLGIPVLGIAAPGAPAG